MKKNIVLIFLFLFFPGISYATITTSWDCQDVDNLPAGYTKSGSPTNVPGKYGNGLYTNEHTEKINMATSGRFEGDEFSIQYWFKGDGAMDAKLDSFHFGSTADSATANSVFIGVNTIISTYFTISVCTDTGVAKYALYDAATVVGTGWNTMRKFRCVVKNNGDVYGTYNIALYINDVYVTPTINNSASNWTYTAANTPANVSIGNIYTAKGSSDEMDGILDELYISNIYNETFPTPTITVSNEPANLRVFPRVVNGSMTVSGTYTNCTPSAIQARIVRDGTSTEEKTWTVIDAAPSGGTFSGILTGIPDSANGWVNLQVRVDDSDVVDNGTNKFAFGILGGVGGQSNAVNFCSQGTGISPDEHISQYIYGTGWSAPSAGNGLIQFCNDIHAAEGVPVALITDTMDDWGSLESWQATPGIFDTNFMAKVNALDGDVDFFIFIGTEQDAIDGATSEEIETWYGSLRSKADSLLHANVPILTNSLGRYTTGSYDTGWNNTRTGNRNYADSDPYTWVGSFSTDLPLNGDIHYTDAGYTTLGERMANTYNYVLGNIAQWQGPTIDYMIKEDSDTILVEITHHSGTDIAAAVSAYTGFAVTGSGVAITNAQRYDADTIELTISGGTANVTGARYLWGQNPTATDCVYDNSSVGLPLEFHLNISEDITPPICTITAPTSETTYASGWVITGPILSNNGDTNPVTISGTASDDTSLSSVTWACSTCTPVSGTATGTTTWSISDLTALGEGINTFTVTAHDSASNTGDDTITINYQGTVTRTPSPTFGNGDVCRLFYTITDRDTGSGVVYIGGYCRIIPLVNRVGSYTLDIEVINYTSPIEFTTSSTYGWGGSIQNVMLERRQDN